MLASLPFILASAVSVPGATFAVLDAPGGERRVELPGSDADWLDPAPWFAGSEGALALSFEGAERPDPPDPDARRLRLRLADGDRLEAGLLGGAGESLRVSALGGRELTLSIDALRSIEFLADGGATSAFEAPAQGDRLYRRTAGGLDRLDGAIVGFGTDAVTFESVLGEQRVAWGQVAALFIEVFADVLEREPGPGAPVALDLVDGSRFHGELSGVRADGLRVAWLAGETIVPLGAVAEVVPADGRIAFLSGLAPVEVREGSPFGDELGMVWPHRMDLAVDGSPLRAAGRRYPRGIGVHAPSTLVFDLAAAGGEPTSPWRELRGRVALDDQVLALPARGSVVFRIRVDGDQRWASPALHGGDPPLAFPPIDLKGAQRLELEVDMAADLHMGDRADWLRMQLLR